MPSATPQQVLDRLRRVNDPELHRDLVSLNMVTDVVVENATVTVHLELTTPACPMKDQVQADVERELLQLPGVSQVRIEWSARVRSSRPGSPQLPGVRNIVAVGAGKGGVGKSTAAVFLAYGLARTGARVGLMDADVYGPSIPTMTGVEGTQPEVRENLIVPVDAGGVKIMSIGFMVDRNKPLIWRGPMTHGVVKQFLEQVDWGELDYMIVDLPPGTGDVPLSLSQTIPLTGAVVICTPQDVALLDARRAVRMFQQLNVPCLGIIENMSYYLCPHCGHRDEIFDHGGAARSSTELGVPFLGEIPLNARIRVHGDAGTPAALFSDVDPHVREALDKVVRAAAGQISVRGSLQQFAPKLTIE